MKSLTIGQAAKKARVGLETIRFYEREGLIQNPPRRPSGYRAYPPEVVDRLRFIRTAKDLGFSLKEIGELLSLQVNPVGSCREVRIIAQTKIEGINERIRTLQRIRRTLRKLAAACETRKPTGECPILESLGKEGKK